LMPTNSSSVSQFRQWSSSVICLLAIKNKFKLT
jgi:hypothetical protein